jgi:hypothetical protein
LSEVPQTFLLFVECGACRQAVSITYEPDAASSVIGAWSCPYGCGHTNESIVPGRWIDVRRGDRWVTPDGADLAPPPGMTLLIACRRCRAALEVAVEASPSRDRLAPVTFHCPECGGRSRFQTGRRVLWVVTAASEDVDITH